MIPQNMATSYVHMLNCALVIGIPITQEETWECGLLTLSHEFEVGFK